MRQNRAPSSGLLLRFCAFVRRFVPERPVNTLIDIAVGSYSVLPAYESFQEGEYIREPLFLSHLDIRDGSSLQRGFSTRKRSRVLNFDPAEGVFGRKDTSALFPVCFFHSPLTIQTATIKWKLVPRQRGDICHQAAHMARPPMAAVLL